MAQEFHTVQICGLTRNLPLFEVAPGVRIAIFNMLGDYEVVEAIAEELARRLTVDADAIMTAEVKSIPLAHAVAVRMKMPYVVARKTKKPYMVGATSVEVLSITTGTPQTLWLDGKDLGLVQGKRIILVDDVISTGSTLAGMRKLVETSAARWSPRRLRSPKATTRTSGSISSPPATCRCSWGNVVLDKLAAAERRYEELNSLMAESATATDSSRLADLAQRASRPGENRQPLPGLSGGRSRTDRRAAHG